MTTTSVHFPEQHWCKKHGVPCTSATIWNECKHTACIRTKPYSSTPVIEIKHKEKKMTNRENGCIDCKHIDKMTEEEPCKRCRNNYTNLWEPVPKVREFTEDELIGAFRDAFVERRAIGILDIENKVKELFE